MKFGPALLILLGSPGCGKVVIVEPVEPPPPPPLHEVEWNDSPWAEIPRLALCADLALEVHGFVDSFAGQDPVDHVAFEALEPISVLVRARGSEGLLDLGLAVWDEACGCYAMTSNLPGNEEWLEFWVMAEGPFRLRVDSPFEGGPWCLELWTSPLPGAWRDGSGEGGGGLVARASAR